MSQTGHIIFYTAKTFDAPVDVLQRIIAWSGAKQISIATRTRGEEHGWASIVAAMSSDEQEEDDDEHLGCGIPLERLPKLYKPRCHLRLDVGVTEPGNRVYEAIKTEIPTSVRKNFVAGDLFVGLGFHDVIDPVPDPHLIARPFLSVEFFGYGTPNHWEAFREVVWQLPVLQEVKRQLEEIAGPLNRYVLWDI